MLLSTARSTVLPDVSSLESAAVTFGLRDNAAFLHCHGVWTGRRRRPASRPCHPGSDCRCRNRSEHVLGCWTVWRSRQCPTLKPTSRCSVQCPMLRVKILTEVRAVLRGAFQAQSGSLRRAGKLLPAAEEITSAILRGGGRQHHRGGVRGWRHCGQLRDRDAHPFRHHSTRSRRLARLRISTWRWSITGAIWLKGA